MKKVLFLLLVFSGCYAQKPLLGVIGTNNTDRPVQGLYKLYMRTPTKLSVLPYSGSSFDVNSLFSISSDTVNRPDIGDVRLAYVNGRLRLVQPTGNTLPIVPVKENFVFQPFVIDSALTGISITKAMIKLPDEVTSIKNFTNSLGTYKTYTNQRVLYFPKHIPNSTITISLVNPVDTLNKDLFFTLVWNKRNIINFNYPIYYTVQNGEGGLTTPTDFGLTQMSSTLQTIPTTNIKASWFVTKDSSMRLFYIKNKKWYIE